jgi:hypothetical protein
MSTSEGQQEDRAARAARNQTLFREINERIKDLNDAAFSAVTPIGEWICECANNSCVERIEMSGEEYEAVRASGIHFCVSPGHVHVRPDVERVQMRNANYWVVEKIGESGKLAAHADPRSDDEPLPLRT